MSPGFYLAHEAVEFVRGDWVLRAAQPNDAPASENPHAMRALAAWRDRNRRRFLELPK